jgi:hypothetical protein
MIVLGLEVSSILEMQNDSRETTYAAKIEFVAVI